MNINAAPRLYTSSLVADSDLNMGQHDIIANALYPRDNYLLSMLDYGQAFPTGVQEGDRVFKWGADSTTSYIYTYLNGAWDAGVKPQHMQDYYIADEKRVVNFCLISPHEFKDGNGSEIYYQSVGKSSSEKLSIYERSVGVLFGPNTYFIGSIGAGIAAVHWGAVSESFDLTVPAGVFYFIFTNCTSVAVSTVRCLEREVVFNFPVSDLAVQRNYSGDVVVFPSKVNSFNIRYDNRGTVVNSGSDSSTFNISLYYFIGE